MISLLETDDAWADIYYNPRTFVAKNRRKDSFWIST
jgi:hypothetical protein